MQHPIIDNFRNFVEEDFAYWLLCNTENLHNTNPFVRDIHEALCYPLRAGGKRVRPVLALLAAHALGGEAILADARKVALALELIHTYSLVHDDLPCMDNDALRRGKPTTHIVYGEAKALLVGDGLLTAAFELLSTLERTHLICACVRILSRAAGRLGMVLGQWMDMSLSAADDVSEELLVELVSRKTGDMLGASLAMGAVLGSDGSLPARAQESMYQAGVYLGVAFQFIDDILDEISTTETMGKTVGKDAQQGKVTAVSLFGIENAQKRADFYTQQALYFLEEVVKESANIYAKVLHDYVRYLLKRTY